MCSGFNPDQLRHSASRLPKAKNVFLVAYLWHHYQNDRDRVSRLEPSYRWGSKRQAAYGNFFATPSRCTSEHAHPIRHPPYCFGLLLLGISSPLSATAEVASQLGLVWSFQVAPSFMPRKCLGERKCTACQQPFPFFTFLLFSLPRLPVQERTVTPVVPQSIVVGEPQTVRVSIHHSPWILFTVRHPIQRLVRRNTRAKKTTSAEDQKKKKGADRYPNHGRNVAAFICQHKPTNGREGFESAVSPLRVVCLRGMWLTACRISYLSLLVQQAIETSRVTC